MTAGRAAPGVDTGGTFTDPVRGGACRAAAVDKAFSTPEAREDGAVREVRRGACTGVSE